MLCKSVNQMFIYCGDGQHGKCLTWQVVDTFHFHIPGGKLTIHLTNRYCQVLNRRVYQFFEQLTLIFLTGLPKCWFLAALWQLTAI